MVVRAVMGPSNAFLAYVDNVCYGVVFDSDITAGAPGVGIAYAPAGNYITNVQFGRYDSTPPTAINANTIGASEFPNEVDLQWQGVTDDTNGIGLWMYIVYRKEPSNPNYQQVATANQPQFADATVSPGITYTYNLQACDFHWSCATTVITVQTPTTGIDARQVGVRPTGSYWGGGGENIDMRSGNLNYTIPLIKARGRGWTLPFNLTYNSQNWRTDGGGTWNLGRDSGFGYGWKLQAGALVPVYTGQFSLHHYLFIDATGAEYRLDVQNGNIWTSKQSVHMEYNSSTSRLYFPDGTFWVFGCTSAGTEQDAGVQDPTTVQDTNAACPTRS